MQMKYLRINLTQHTTSIVPIHKRDVERFLGGRGIAARLLSDHISLGVDPLGADSDILIATGALNGTPAPSSGRMSLAARSPATGLYLKSSVGGRFGSRLRFAGVDGVILTGCSEAPCVLVILDGAVQFISATPIWGSDVFETVSWVNGQWKGAEVLSIGPAGERQALMACVMSGTFCAAGRGGLGAVFGAKRLKAIVVQGTGSVAVESPEELMRASLEIRRALANDSTAQVLSAYGTAGFLKSTNESHALPVDNFRRAFIEGVETLDGTALVSQGYVKRRSGCSSCTLGCHRIMQVNNREPRSLSGGAEYETMAALGAGTGILDPVIVLKANELCNRYGLDTISVGSAVQWAMECFEKGLLSRKDTDGLALRFGDSGILIPLIEKIAAREGIGELLANGVRRAAELLGDESWKWAVEARGLEQSRIDTRTAKAHALAFAVNPRGPDHLHAQPLAEYGDGRGAVAVIASVTGDPRCADPISLSRRAEIVRWHEDLYAVCDAIGMCTFATLWSYVVGPEDLVRLYGAASGQFLSTGELLLAGRRIVTLERLMNVRLGLSQRDDRLPWRLMNESADGALVDGACNTEEELKTLTSQYYELHGWDEKGRPTDACLRHVGLAEFGLGSTRR